MKILILSATFLNSRLITAFVTSQLVFIIKYSPRARYMKINPVDMKLPRTKIITRLFTSGAIRTSLSVHVHFGLMIHFDVEMYTCISRTDLYDHSSHFTRHFDALYQ